MKVDDIIGWYIDRYIDVEMGIKLRWSVKMLIMMYTAMIMMTLEVVMMMKYNYKFKINLILRMKALLVNMS